MKQNNQSIPSTARPAKALPFLPAAAVAEVAGSLSQLTPSAAAAGSFP